MTTFIIIVSIAAALALFVGIAAANVSDHIDARVKSRTLGTIAGLLFAAAGMALIFAYFFLLQEYAYKEALRGNNAYRMEVQYKESTVTPGHYVPTDTVFIRKKRRVVW